MYMAKKERPLKYQTLGENVIPSRYVLVLKPNLKTFKYLGEEEIEVRIAKKTREIALNASELEIRRASVMVGTYEHSAVVSEDKPKQRIILKLKDAVSGNATIKIGFVGTNNAEMYGFYRSSYKQGEKTRYILSSQFEAANARNAFPCFDEPAFKAVFDLSFVVDKELDCISNMPILSTKKSGSGTKLVRFMQTPRMSTYLLYLGVGNYDYITGKVGKIDVRVITTPGKRDLGKLPMEYAKKFIEFFQEYFGVDYPLPKADFIGIPDFAAGAMENWGAITFRETALLSSEESSIATKQRVAEVIAHELVHQWFGDLVTMKWWNDLWLNESFATFMSYKAMDAVFPEWKMRTEYKRDVIATAFGADQLKSTHPISVPVRSSGEVDQIFDEISYDKGGTVLNMIEDYSGEEIFRKGLTNYLNKHAYSNATKFDLWQAIDEEARRNRKRINVYDVASFWVDTPGYPSVSVRKSGSGFELSQQRYFLLKDVKDSTIWPIPINYSLSGSEGSMLLGKKSASILAQGGAWLKLNAGQNGLYRVFYEKEDLDRLGYLVKEQKLDPVDSWGIENDAYAMIRSARSRASGYLEFAEKYCLTNEYPLSSNVLGHLGFINDMLDGEDGLISKELIIRYTNQLIEDLGWSRKESESTFDTAMRSAAILRSARAGYEPTIDKAKDLFNDYLGGKPLEANLRSSIFYVNAWVGDARTFDTLKERYISEKVPEEKSRFLNSLAMFGDKKLLLKAFDFSMSKDVRLQDSYAIVAIGSSNPVGKDLVLGWTKRNWKALMKRFASGTHMLSRYVDNLAVLRTREDLKAVKSFFSKKENMREDLRQALANTLEEIESNIAFMEANR